ncbi:hypothetical protein EDC04DRAFT_2699438, partial [Pisolithus marmoratus]
MCTAVWDMELPVRLSLHLTCILYGSSSLSSACVGVHCTICRCGTSQYDIIWYSKHPLHDQTPQLKMEFICV